MRYFIVAGEKSGDLHASNLIKALHEADANATIACWGGDAMQEAGAQLLRHYRTYSLMGIAEIVSKLPSLLRSLSQCKADILAFAPDAVILVDFAGFNMRLAKFSKEKGLRTFYYISPKIWAWNQNRAYKVKQYVDRMFVIMHFEQAFYRKFGYEVDYVGNPLFDAIRAFVPSDNFHAENSLSHKPIIALLPGSRHQEVTLMLPVMVQAANEYRAQGYQIVVAGVDNLPIELYAPAKERSIPIVLNNTYNLLHNSAFALVTSGTATLETALFGVPQVVCYKTSWLTYQIMRHFVKVRYISLVNLIADKAVVEELIQESCNADAVSAALSRAIANESRIKSEYEAMRQTIATEGTSKRTAQLMIGYLGAEK